MPRELFGFWSLVPWRRGFRLAILVFPVTDRRAGHGSHQGEAEGYIEDWEGVEEESGCEQRDDRYQLGVVQDVVEDEEKKSCGENRQGAVERVGETEVMAEDEAGHAQEEEEKSE
jgi:hypothetical protein